MALLCFKLFAVFGVLQRHRVCWIILIQFGAFKLDYDYSFIVSPIALLQFFVNENLDNMAAIIIVFIVQIAVTYLAGDYCIQASKSRGSRNYCFR